jgi:hypothetical protein
LTADADISSQLLDKPRYLPHYVSLARKLLVIYADSANSRSVMGALFRFLAEIALSRPARLLRQVEFAKRRRTMANNITVVGVVGNKASDEKPLPVAVKTKIQQALKTALARELVSESEVLFPASHFSITHTSIVFDEE